MVIAMTQEEKKALCMDLEKKLGCSLSTLAELLRDLPNVEKSEVYEYDDSLKSKKSEYAMIALLLNELGVPAHIKGYQYLKEAIYICMHNPQFINQMMNVLYPSIAETYKVSPSKVEKSIRDAIATAWKKANNQKVQSTFSYIFDLSKDRPKNRQFIATVSEHLFISCNR